MKIITLLNEKGGVGKTTLTINIAGKLAAMEYVVVLVDGDPQGNATLATRTERGDGLFNLVANHAAFQDVLVPVSPQWYGCPNDTETRLLMLPGNEQTKALEKDNRAFDLVHRLRELADSAVDFVLIDTNPSISDLHIAYFLASDYILFPTECARYSIDGLKRSLQHLENAQAEGKINNVRVAEMLGIIPTKYYEREKVQWQLWGWLQGRFGDEKVFDPITRRTVWTKAEASARPIHAYDPSSPAAREIDNLVTKILERIS